MLYLDVFKIKEPKIEHIGNSNHCLTNSNIITKIVKS